MPTQMTIPTIDLSPFFIPGDESGQKKAKELIAEACAQYGFFQIVNHGIPLDLMKQAIEFSKMYFNYPDEVKQECGSKEGAPLPNGYYKYPEELPDKREFLLMFPPQSPFNSLPNDPPHYRETLDEMFKYFVKTGHILEGIINDCLGFPPNFLKEYNDDRSWDFLMACRYPPASNTENNGISGHEDGNLFTMVLQEDTGGLEVLKDGDWIPLIPSEGTLGVNLGDVIQILSNKKFKSVTHRVVRPKVRSRHSYVFFYNLQGEKWVEPLPNFTKEIGEKPKYKGFYYKDYQNLRKIEPTTHSSSAPQESFNIQHFEIC